MPSAPPTSGSPETLPRTVGRYELHSVLGSGGMATVYAAWLSGPAGFRKEVAVKVIKADVLRDSAGAEIEAFIREARLGGLLKHPNIVDTYELSEVDGQLLISMELVRGMTLWDLIRSGHVPPAAVLLELAVGIAAGLSSAHAMSVEGSETGLVHRDLKPSNVMVSWNGAVKVMDFGIATTQFGELAAATQSFSTGRGTPSYMSPEQLLAEPLDGRSDLFPLGLILTELANARFLPRQKLFQSILQGNGRASVVVEETDYQGLDAAAPGLAGIVRRCIQPHAEQRYASTGALLHALDGLRATVGVREGLRTWLHKTFRHPGAAAAPQSRPADLLELGTITLEPDALSELSTGPDAAAAPSAFELKKTNLVATPDQFIGRSSLLTELAERFSQGARLVTLKGTGGIGKTRLARRYAVGQVALLAGGAWFVDLAEAVTTNGVVQATAMALDLPLRGGGLDVLELQVGRSIAGRGAVLLVFDNLEQVVEHAVGTLSRWLEMAPEARVLVTSRERLMVSGEELIEVPPLHEDDAIELFCSRARAAGARWPDNDRTRASIRSIVHQVDALPLAIELAAARSRALSPSQIEARLTQRFRLLRGGRRGDSDRHASLQGLIDWSWGLLAPWEQAALAQLSVFRDGFCMDAAEAVLDLSAWPDAPWSLDVVGALLDKSLIYSQDIQEQPRFRMYRSIQAYADDRLGANRRATHVRHLNHYASFGEDVVLEELFTHGFEQRVDTLLREQENLLAAIDTSLAEPLADPGGRCALALGMLRQIRGPYLDGLALMEKLLTLDMTSAVRGRLLRRVGWLHYASGKLDAARDYFERALATHRADGDRCQEGLAIGNLANCLLRRGQTAAAIVEYKAAIAIHQETGNRHGEGSSTGNMAIAHEFQGDRETALHLHQTALRIARELGSTSEEANRLGNLGICMVVAGRADEAQRCYRQAIQLGRRLRELESVAVYSGNLADSLRDAGQFDEALELYEESLRLGREVGSERKVSVAIGAIGVLYLKTGRLGEAEEMLRDAVERSVTVGGFGLGFFRAWLAVVRARRGDFSEARTLLDQARAEVRGFRPTVRGTNLCNRATVELLAGDRAASEAALAEAEALNQSSGLGPGSKLLSLVAEVRAEAARKDASAAPPPQ